jgi:hypothetical protein
MFSAPFLVTLLDRVKAIVRRAAGPVAERVRPEPSHAAAGCTVDRPISPALRRRAQGWMAAKLQALSKLMRRVEADDVRKPPAHMRRAASSAPTTRIPGLPEERLPRGFGWMCPFGPTVRIDGRAFAELLDEPWMKAKVLAAPERMAGLIGPILTATGERRPAWFPVVPKRAGVARRGASDVCKSASDCAVEEVEPRAAAVSDVARCAVLSRAPAPGKRVDPKSKCLPTLAALRTVPDARSQASPWPRPVVRVPHHNTATVATSQNRDEIGMPATFVHFVAIT